MEMDYRKIPYDELDSNIPQGRGMIKWQPFATTPELYERIEQMMDDQAKVEAPAHDDEVLMMLEEQLRRSLGQRIVLRYWNNGYEVQLECQLEYIDNRSRMIVVSKEGELLNISFDNIYEVI